MYECLNGVSGFVFGFRCLSSGWSCLNLSVDVCMHDVWMSGRIVRMLWRICLNNGWMSEWSVRICFWISFPFFWVVLSISFWMCVWMMYECLNELWECCGESVWIMYECLNGVSGFVFGFRFLSFGWSCLNLSVDVCMNDVWMSERIVRMLWRICLNHVWISEWNVRICFWISFSFFWVVLSKLFCGCVYEWCMNVWTNC